MLSLSTGDLISINRSCLTATGISVALYSYASKYESNTRKAGIIKDVAIVLMIYTLICLISFNGIAIMTKNTDITIIAYAVFTIIMLSIAIFMIYTNLN
jgi:ACR3 family arsenite efflux pump ArsB|tara:strand:+ start:173 stop:469 length:297 start_codon:yes stop_codon:yes gene_type:complete